MEDTRIDYREIFALYNHYKIEQRDRIIYVRVLEPLVDDGFRAVTVIYNKKDKSYTSDIRYLSKAFYRLHLYKIEKIGSITFNNMLEKAYYFLLQY